MDKKQAQELIKKTFESPFDEVRFTNFIRNLLNRIDDAPFIYQGNYIHDAYKQYITTLERIGKFSDGENRWSLFHQKKCVGKDNIQFYERSARCPVSRTSRKSHERKSTSRKYDKADTHVYNEHFLLYSNSKGYSTYSNNKEILGILRKHKYQSRYVPEDIEKGEQKTINIKRQNQRLDQRPDTTKGHGGNTESV